MKLHWLLPVSGSLILLLNSCSVPGGGSGNAFRTPSEAITPGIRSGDKAITRNSIDSMINSPSGGRIDSSEAFAAPRKERPGLATTWGESVTAPMPSTAFQRATAKPYGVDAIYYNNREGLKAMDAMDDKISGLQQTAGGVMEWGVKGSIGYLPTYLSYQYYMEKWSTRRFVQGSHGEAYTIVLKNRCKSALQVVLSVDGLDVIDGKPASVQKRGYVVQAGQTLEVEGFRNSYNSVARFRFSSVSNSYANLSRGDTRNVGVIGLAVYTQKGVDPWTWMPNEVNARNNANPFAKAP